MDKDLEFQIEDCISQRNEDLALDLIKKAQVNAHFYGDQNKILGWYFKLGFYKKGYKEALKFLEYISNKEHIDSLKIWIARFLNSLGSGYHALLLISESKKTKNKDENYFKAGVYLSNYAFKSAIECYKESILPLDKKVKSKFPMRVLAYTDSLSGEGRNNEAYDIAYSLLNETQKPLDEFIIHTACMEYLCKERRVKEAEFHFKNGEPLIDHNEHKVDYALYLKWSGVYLCLKGIKNEGKELLFRSINQFKSFQVRDEAWISIYEYLYEFHFIDKETFSSISYYPGLCRNLTKLWLEKYPEINMEVRFENGIGSPIYIDFDSKEYKINGKWSLNFKKEIQLLGLLCMAENHQLSVQKINDSLWPDEAYSYLQFEERVFQLIKRLKKLFEIEIIFNEGILHFNKLGNLVEVKIGGSEYLSFLRENQSFKGKEFENYYNLSPKSSSKYLKSLICEGLLMKYGSGKATMYNVLGFC